MKFDQDQNSDAAHPQIERNDLKTYFEGIALDQLPRPHPGYISLIHIEQLKNRMFYCDRIKGKVPYVLSQIAVRTKNKNKIVKPKA